MLGMAVMVSGGMVRAYIARIAGYSDWVEWVKSKRAHRYKMLLGTLINPLPSHEAFRMYKGANGV
jgi:hypothetical protein